MANRFLPYLDGANATRSLAHGRIAHPAYVSPSPIAPWLSAVSTGPTCKPGYPCLRVLDLTPSTIRLDQWPGKAARGRLAPRPRFRFIPAAASSSPPAMAMPRRERIGGAIANAGTEQGKPVRRKRQVIGEKRKRGAEIWNVFRTPIPPSLAFVPSSQNPGIAVLVSNTGRTLVILFMY